MTREEAIKAFRGLSGVLLPREYYREAIQMAIEALSREPSEDAISRQAAKLKVARVIWEDGDSCYDFHDKCVDCLDDVPSAQPEQRWVSTSERLPEEDLWTGIGKQYSNSVLMTVFDKSDGEIIVDYGHTRNGEWYSETANEFIESIPDWKVIAWMSLPEPYRKDGEAEC